MMHPMRKPDKPKPAGAYRGALFAALLIGFPLSNVLVLFTTQLAPGLFGGSALSEKGGSAVEPPLPVPTPHDPAAAAAGGAGVPSVVEGGADGGTPAPAQQAAAKAEWPRLRELVQKDPMFKQYESFYDTGAQSWRIQKYGRVCIISHEFLGPSATTGLATTLSSLAEVLATHGFEVTLLYTRGFKVDTADVDFWMQYYASRGIRFQPLPPTPVPYDVPDAVAVSHRLYVWLSQQAPFDVVHLPDNRGLPYFTLNAKAQDINFQHTQFILHSQKPHLWYKMGSLAMLDTLHDLILDHLERESLRLADYVVSPTQYMLDWKESNGWPMDPDGQWTNPMAGVIPKRHKTREGNEKFTVHPNILPQWVQRRKRTVLEDVAIVELVFFTRFELRKGLVLFCDTLDRLALKSADMEGIKVTFLGRLPTEISEQLQMKGGVRTKADEYIKQRSRKWKFPWQILKDMDAQARMDYMKGNGRLAVLPSLMENFAYTVQECLTAGVPFIATNVGGTSELVLPEDRARVLLRAHPKPIASRLREIIRDGLRPARPVEHTEVEKTWAVWHHMILAKTKAAKAASLQKYAQPLVTICIVTFNNPDLLQQAIKSIEEQDYPKIEVVIVDDGSPKPEAQAYLEEIKKNYAHKGWQVLRQENRGPGAGRNYGATHARGEFIMFMDDDNYAKPYEVSTFIRVAAHTGADVLTTCNDYFYGNDPPGDRTPSGRWVPLGSATTVGMFQNLYGDTNAMIRKSVFDALGGFPEDYGYALEDWELFSKSVLGGYKLQMIPEPLYWYRLRDGSHSRSTVKVGNAARTIRPYLRQIPQHLHHLVLFAQGMKDSHDLVHVELEREHDSQNELRKILRALSNSLSGLCEQGKLPMHSRNLLRNSEFGESAGPGSKEVAVWRSYGSGYLHDATGGRISYGSTDSYGLRFTNTDWNDSRGATQEVLLDQQTAAAVVVSGWSKAEKVSGSTDSGYAIYIDIAFQDGTKLWGHAIPFDVGSHGWQFKAGVVEPDRAIHSMHFYVMFRWHSGTVYFDDLAVSMLSDGLCDYTQLTLQALSAVDDSKEDAAGHH